MIWRAGVSVATISSINMLPKESSHLFPDHRGRSFRVAEFYIWSAGRNTIDSATQYPWGHLSAMRSLCRVSSLLRPQRQAHTSTQ